VAQGQQGRGVGNALLKRTIAQAEKAQASEKALITFAFNAVSHGLYIRHGLFPRLPLYLFSVSREARLPRAPSASFAASAIDMSHLKEIAAIDARALGVSREKHHRYLIADSGLKGFLFREDGVGYAYISPEGHVGPLAVMRADAVRPVFAAALNQAAELGATQLSALIPGICDAALGAAVAQGMRIALPMMLMSSRPFGD
jgi:hypothetical protein